MAEERDWVAIVTSQECPDCGLSASAPDRSALPGELLDRVGQWRELLAGDDTPLRRRPAPDRWSALELGAHIRDQLAVFGDRVVRVQAEDDPFLGWWDHEAAAVEERYNEQDPRAVAEALQANAERLVGLVGELDERQWQRTGVRRPGEQFTVEGMVRLSLHESNHHLWDARRALEASPPG